MWIFDRYDINVLNRNTKFNKCVVTNKHYMDIMASDFNSWFGEFSDYSDSVAHIMYFPIHLEYGGIGALKTPKLLSSGVLARTIPEESSYLYMGQFYVKPRYTDFRDYNDSTKIRIYLPFCGWFDIDPKECMERYLQFRLVVDYTTGLACYIVGVSPIAINATNDTAKGHNPIADANMRVIATYEFQLGVDIPMGSTNAADIARTVALNAVKTAGSAALSIALHNPTPSIITSTSTRTYDIQGRGQYKGARMKQMRSGTVTDTSVRETHSSLDIKQISSNVFESGLNLMNINVPTQTSDRPSNSNVNRYMGRNIYVVMYYQNYSENDIYSNQQYAHTFGLPLAQHRVLGTLRGYTTVGEIHFEALKDDSGDIGHATQFEIESIVSQLKNGVIL